MEIFQSVFIGLVQGITEFLPISSSAHLVIIPYIMNWPYQGLTFDVSLHLGTVLAILLFFWRDWISIIKNGLSKNTTQSDYPKNFLWQIVLASIPAAIVGFLIQDKVEEYFHEPLLIAVNMAIFGLILFLVDKYSKNTLMIQEAGIGRTLIVGLAQCLALIPGVSRSGITIIASRGIGLNRENAARFSFLLGTPAMVGAFVLKIKDVDPTTLDFTFWIGVLVSAISGYLAIKFLISFLQKSNFSLFVGYRMLFAIIVIFVYLLR
jgi:undecaprenyl-diphosphatase